MKLKFEHPYEHCCYVDIWYKYQGNRSELVKEKTLIENEIEIEEPYDKKHSYVICVELTDKTSKVELGYCIIDNLETHHFYNYAIAEQFYKMVNDKPRLDSEEFLNKARIEGYSVSAVDVVGTLLPKKQIPSNHEKDEMVQYINHKWTWLDKFTFNEDYNKLIVNRIFPDTAFGYIPVSLSYYHIIERMPCNFDKFVEQAMDQACEVIKNANKFEKITPKHILYIIIYEVSRMIGRYVSYKSDTVGGKPVDTYSSNALNYGCGDCEDMSYIAYGCFMLIKSGKIHIPKPLSPGVKLLSNYSVGCMLCYANSYEKQVDIGRAEYFYHMTCGLFPKKGTSSDLVPLFCDGTISIFPNMFIHLGEDVLSNLRGIFPHYFTNMPMKFTGEDFDEDAFIYNQAYVFYSEDVDGKHTLFLIQDDKNKSIGINVKDMPKRQFTLICDHTEKISLHKLHSIWKKYEMCKPYKIKMKHIAKETCIIPSLRL